MHTSIPPLSQQARHCCKAAIHVQVQVVEITVGSLGHASFYVTEGSSHRKAL